MPLRASAVFTGCAFCFGPWLVLNQACDPPAEVQSRSMLGEPRNQFSLDRVELSSSDTKTNVLSVLFAGQNERLGLGVSFGLQGRCCHPHILLQIE